LKTFFTHKKSLHIGIRSDNTTAVAYVNEMGGMTSILLDNLSAEIWSWCSEKDIFLTAQYIPGNENLVLIMCQEILQVQTHNYINRQNQSTTGNL
jgi:hypothetical protein